MMMKSDLSLILKKVNRGKKDQGKEITLIKSAFVAMLELKSSVIVSDTV
jgi:hypothetical protein